MSNIQYLSDIPDRIVYQRQGWGVLGYDVCAHTPEQIPLRLQIGDRLYAKGLGHHAAGKLVIDLQGGCSAFDAEVGVQKQNALEGSVVFRAYVDGKLAFDSGLMRQTSAPKALHVNLTGAQELILESADGGDGIICDCADWCDARLTVLKPGYKPVTDWFDMSPDATVCSWDAKRMEGVRSSRIEEFDENEVYLDEHVTGKSVPDSGCLGLVWLEPRRFQRLTIGFSRDLTDADLDGAEVQGWVGPYPFQGTWRKLKGTIDHRQKTLQFVLDSSELSTDGFRKVRWLVPQLKGAKVSLISALHATQLQATTVHLQSKLPKKTAFKVTGYNCRSDVSTWQATKPGTLSIVAPRQFSWDDGPLQSSIRIENSTGGFSIALRDLIEYKRIEVKEYGIELSVGPQAKSLKKQALTVLDRVRQMPDQTFATAMAKTHNPIQDNGPLLVSLGSDNWKWLTDQDGSVIWTPQPEDASAYMGEVNRPCAIVPTLNGHPLIDNVRPRLKPSRLNAWMPRNVVRYADDALSGECEQFVAPLDGQGSMFVSSYQLRAKGNEDLRATLRLEIFSERSTNTFAQIEHHGSWIVALRQGKVIALVGLYNPSGQQIGWTDDSVKIVNSSINIQPSGSLSKQARVVVYSPGWVLEQQDVPRLTVDLKRLYSDFEKYWLHWATEGIQIDIPDKFLQNVIKSSQARCVVDSRNEDNGKRIAPWIAEIHYGALESEANTIVRGMALMGHQAYTQRCLDYFIHLYNPKGFLTTGYTVLGTGWHLWTLGEFFSLYRDREWLASHADAVVKVANWIVSQRHKTMKLEATGAKPVAYGLMPPGVIADWNAYQYYFYSNGMYCAALEKVGLTLDSIGRPEGRHYIEESLAFRQDILRAYRWAQARTPAVQLQDGSWVPGMPSQISCLGPLNRFFPGDDGSRAWCYDVEVGAHQLVQQGILPSNSQVAQDCANYLEDVMYLAEGWFDYSAVKNHADWFNMGGFSKVQPFYSRMNEVYAMMDDVKPFIRSYFNAVAALLNTRNLTLWEHFHNAGAPDKTHETGVFLQLTRFMFVFEHDHELILAPFTPDRWFSEGDAISVQHAPTQWGEVGYRIESHVDQNTIEATVHAPLLPKGCKLLMRIRHPHQKLMRKVLVNGKNWKQFDPRRQIVTLPTELREISVKVLY